MITFKMDEWHYEYNITFLINCQKKKKTRGNSFKNKIKINLKGTKKKILCRFNFSKLKWNIKVVDAASKEK